jgi:hypothetical protein
MLKVSDYRKHAEECRRLARQSALPHIREQLPKLAETWDELGEQRAQELAKQKPGQKLGLKGRQIRS